MNDSATTAPPPAPARLLSLRRKGLLALLAVFGLIVLLGALVLAYKTSTEADFDAVARLVAPHDADPEAGALAGRVALVREHGRAMAVMLATTAGLGVALIGMAVVLFFARLSYDIEALRRGALAVVAGARTPPPAPERSDELGDLASALGTLVRSLAAREADLEIERRHALHREKMAAVGALAAGVLNDIGNPIAAIDGFARAMRESHTQGECRIDPGLCDPELILHETARLQVITRQIAQLATELPSVPQLLSLNDIVRTALLLVHFDPRLAGVQVDTGLDPQLPAVPGMADRLLQLVMGLIVHAADAALAGAGGERGRPLIAIRTAFLDGTVELSVADNGAGMNELLVRRTLERTDTPADPADAGGTVLGLAACRAIVQQHGGAARVCRGDAGLQVRVSLPLQPAPALGSVLA